MVGQCWYDRVSWYVSVLFIINIGTLSGWRFRPSKKNVPFAGHHPNHYWTQKNLEITKVPSKWMRAYTWLIEYIYMYTHRIEIQNISKHYIHSSYPRCFMVNSSFLLLLCGTLTLEINKVPIPAPVPPPREWQSWKPWRQSQPPKGSHDMGEMVNDG